GGGWTGQAASRQQGRPACGRRRWQQECAVFVRRICRRGVSFGRVFAGTVFARTSLARAVVACGNTMSPSRLFILRPVATTLLMVGLLLVGLVAYSQLPVSALPEVDYPTIQVVTFYPGADPDVMASSVTAPLERQFGQVPGLSQMTSTSSLGSSIVTLQFTLDQ